MVIAKEQGMGRFSVEVELKNYDDLALSKRGALPPERVRRMTLRGVVDSGASWLVLPESVAQELGLEPSGTTSVRYADSRTALRPTVQGIHLTYDDRSSIFNAILEPRRDSALIGAIVLEDLDLVVDGSRQTLTPRDPKHIVSEIE